MLENVQSSAGALAARAESATSKKPAATEMAGKLASVTPEQSDASAVATAKSADGNIAVKVTVGPNDTTAADKSAQTQAESQQVAVTVNLTVADGSKPQASQSGSQKAEAKLADTTSANPGSGEKKSEATKTATTTAATSKPADSKSDDVEAFFAKNPEFAKLLEALLEFMKAGSKGEPKSVAKNEPKTSENDLMMLMQIIFALMASIMQSSNQNMAGGPPMNIGVGNGNGSGYNDGYMYAQGAGQGAQDAFGSSMFGSMFGSLFGSDSSSSSGSSGSSYYYDPLRAEFQGLYKEASATNFDPTAIATMSYQNIAGIMQRHYGGDGMLGSGQQNKGAMSVA